jgi:hypothetical protein
MLPTRGDAAEKGEGQGERAVKGEGQGESSKGLRAVPEQAALAAALEGTH